MRAGLLFVVSLTVALEGSACSHGATIRILDARAFRGGDKRVAVDVDLEAVEQGGAGAGAYCVSVHWFNVGFNPLTEPLRAYPGELDSVEHCAKDLGDGDRRTIRLVSNVATLVTGLPARVQIWHEGTYQTNEAVFAP